MHVSFMVEYIFNTTLCKLEKNAHATLDIYHMYTAVLDHSSVIPSRACGVQNAMLLAKSATESYMYVHISGHFNLPCTFGCWWQGTLPRMHTGHVCGV